MKRSILFRRALPEDADTIYALYRSVSGDGFCIWNEAYPSMENIRQDLAAGSLYVLTAQAELLGAVSIVPENEMDDFSCWRCKQAREIARVAVARKAQGQGLALEMVQQILRILRSQGCQAVHLSVAKHHLPARKTYQRAGFAIVGHADLYGNSYDLMEIRLSEIDPQKNPQTSHGCYTNSR